MGLRQWAVLSISATLAGSGCEGKGRVMGQAATAGPTLGATCEKRPNLKPRNLTLYDKYRFGSRTLCNALRASASKSLGAALPRRGRPWVGAWGAPWCTVRSPQLIQQFRLKRRKGALPWGGSGASRLRRSRWGASLASCPLPTQKGPPVGSPFVLSSPGSRQNFFETRLSPGQRFLAKTRPGWPSGSKPQSKRPPLVERPFL